MCNEKARQKQLLVLVSQAMERRVMYKGKSQSTILQIQRQHGENFWNPRGWEGKRGKRKAVCVDNFDKRISETQSRISVCMRRKSQLSPSCYQ